MLKTVVYTSGSYGEASLVMNIVFIINILYECSMFTLL